MNRTSKRSVAVLGGAIFLTGATGCLTLPTEQAPAAESADDATRCMGRCDQGLSQGDITGLNDFEFIIVGSGAGGGPLAANLSKNHKVLLLEAGGDPGSDNSSPSTRIHYQVPSYHRESTEDPAMRWDYLVEHYSDQQLAQSDTKYCGPGATGAFCDSIADRGPNGPTGVFYPRSSALGGCTAHNAMISIAPQDSDWQNIVDITGDTTWNPAAMRGLFAEIERNHYLDASKPDSDPIWQGHGRNGWLSIEFPDSRLALGDPKILIAVQGAQQAFTQTHGGNAIDSLEGLLGLMNRDLNVASGLQENLYTIPLAVDNATGKHMRNGTREVLIEAINRPNTNLTIRLHSLVTKVVFADEVGGADPQRAVGVDFIDGVRLYHADRTMSLKPGSPLSETRRVLVGNPGEVILSAGAFNTPQLLMQSGIGPREHLEAVHVVDDAHPIRVDLPGVGGNLQDRYEVGVIGTFTGYATAWPHFILDGHFDGARETPGMLDILGKCTFGIDADTAHPGRTPDPNDPCLLQWQQGQGPYGSNGAVTAILHRSGTAANGDPDLVIFGLPGEFHGYHLDYSGNLVRNQFTWAILKSHTQNSVVTSRTDAQGNTVRDLSGTGGGTVRLRPNPNDPSLPPDPRVPPAINFHSFQEGRNDQGQGDRDLEAVVDGTLIALQVGVDMNRKMRLLGLGSGNYTTDWPNASVLMPATGAAAFQKMVSKNSQWYAKCSGTPDRRPDGCDGMRARLREWVRREAWGHHASCTAPIGIADVNNDPELQTNPGNAVLDSHFRVRGTRGLRVVDASVFPQIPGEFVVMPVYMISQKAYHTIEADWASAPAADPAPQPQPDEQIPDPPATCGDPGAYCSEPGECCSGECDVDWNECI